MLGLEGAVEVAVLAVKFLVSVFGVTVFAQVGALAASAGERDHGFSLSVLIGTLPNIDVLKHAYIHRRIEIVAFPQVPG